MEFLILSLLNLDRMKRFFLPKAICGILIFLFGNQLKAQTGWGNLEKMMQNDSTVFLITSKGTVTLRFFPGDIVQTTIESSVYTGEQISNAVLLRATGVWKKLKEDAGRIELESGKQIVLIEKNPFAVTYHSGKSRLRFTGQSLKDGYQTLAFQTESGEQFFGTGSRSTPINKNGARTTLNNNPWYGYNIDADNLNFSMPFFQSDKGYGVFFDNPSIGYFDFGKTQSSIIEAGFKAGKLQFYTFFGSNPAEIIHAFTSLVGRMPLPPRWALGNFMSRYGYRNQNEVLDIAKQMKGDQFPMDAVIIDLFWFGNGEHGSWNMGNLDWNKTRFPDPEKMIRDLKKQNIKTILIAEPFVLTESSNYAYTQQNKLNAVTKEGDTTSIKEFYFGYSGLLDIFKNKSKDWFWQQYDRQIRKGVAGWWGDLGEPEKHPSYLYHNLEDLGQRRLFNAEEVHNIYGHLWSQLLYEKYAQHYPEERLFHLNRSGYAGSWRYGSFPWSGDVERSWNGFKAQLPIMLSMGLSGVPTMHSDAGGFAMGQRDPELYRRWLQMAVFTPIFRPHGSVSAPDPNIPQIESEPVFYSEPEKSTLREFVRLRYKLMPYVYRLSYEAATKGDPFVRPMFYSDTTDRALFTATDQYYFGSSLVVAPVLEKAATSRRLYLPKGIWYNYWDPSKTEEGGKWLVVKTNAEQIPVYVKAGSTLLQKPVFEHTEEYPGDQLEFHCFADKGLHTDTYYEDDGKNPTALSSGKHELISITTRQKGKQYRIQIRTKGTAYEGKPDQRECNVFLYGFVKPRAVIVNGEPLQNWIVNGTTVEVKGLKWDGSPLEIYLR
jgi:oligosaccharide 4-alpha-D-glucosyltransferase